MLQPTSGPGQEAGQTYESSLSLRALLAAAAKSLVTAFPAACVVVVRNDGAEPVVKVVGGCNVPPGWLRRLLALKDFPLLQAALEQPERVIERYVRFAPAGAARGAMPRPLSQALCTALAFDGGPRYALLMLAPPDPREAHPRLAALEQARLTVRAIHTAGGGNRVKTLTAIHRAKLEWELSVDALPEMVGLLDRNLRVMRISRTLERWQLGDVKDAIGKDLHAVLHSGCKDETCRLRGCLAAAGERVRDRSPAQFELNDPVLERELVVSLRPPAARGPETQASAQLRAVFTVMDVTSQRATERELKVLNQSLEDRVAERTDRLTAANQALQEEVARRRAAEHSLRRSMRELESLSEQLVNAQEAERKRISQDLHDSVGQTLSAIKYSLERAQELQRRESRSAAAPVVDVVIGRVQRLMDEVRAISMNLRPAMLDDLGAASAVRGLCRDWQAVYRDVEMQVEIAVEDADIPALLVTKVFRAVQEALNNVARHAAARHVIISMRIDSGVLAVMVRDDGIGFDSGDDPLTTVGSRGLRGLRERCESSGGRFELWSCPGEGTRVTLQWPVAAGQAARLANASLN
ncbi:MAG TPA: histidine kinase [Steroidobacteraceae bacterium]|nr:histidine kinase [Steroidobacteraceae bacterium]